MHAAQLGDGESLIAEKPSDEQAEMKEASEPVSSSQIPGDSIQPNSLDAPVQETLENDETPVQVVEVIEPVADVAAS